MLLCTTVTIFQEIYVMSNTLLDLRHACSPSAGADCCKAVSASCKRYSVSMPKCADRSNVGKTALVAFPLAREVRRRVRVMGRLNRGLGGLDPRRRAVPVIS